MAEQYISYQFLNVMSSMHKRIYEKNALNMPARSRLDKLSHQINSSLQNTSLSHLSPFHPSTWTHHGHPHDTFAVEFAHKDPYLSLFLQALPAIVVVVLIIMAWLIWPEQGIKQYVEESEDVVDERESKKKR